MQELYMKLRYIIIVLVVLAVGAVVALLATGTNKSVASLGLKDSPVDSFMNEHAGSLLTYDHPTRVRFIGLRHNAMNAALSNLPAGANVRLAGDGETADVRIVNVLDWAQLDQIKGAQSLCGNACKPESDLWLGRHFTRDDDGNLIKYVFVKFSDFVEIRGNIFVFSDKEALACLLTRLQDEISYVMGDGLDRSCLDKLSARSEATTVSWND